METGFRDWDSKGIIRIGASITIGSQFLPNYVKSFYEVCPEIDVRVTIEQSERLEQKILANELDCAASNSAFLAISFLSFKLYSSKSVSDESETIRLEASFIESVIISFSIKLYSGHLLTTSL